MARRIHVRQVRLGTISLDAAEAHHARDVLRLGVGAMVELFDNTGQLADATLTRADAGGVQAAVQQVRAGPPRGQVLTVAAAVPKGDRADWMVEKLSELGVDRFIPLATARSVVLPTGKSKTERWQRIAVESAKQSRRSGVMEIAPLTPLYKAIHAIGPAWYLSTIPGCRSIPDALGSDESRGSLSLFIGPEGGWTDQETAQFKSERFTAIGLTQTTLRVETAAVAAAAVVACCRPAVARTPG